MATKKFIIEVEEGRTKCDDFCPLKHNNHCVDVDGYVEDVIPFLRCMKYNLATIKIKELISYEEDDKFCIDTNDVSNYVLNAILDTHKKMIEEENESKSKSNRRDSRCLKTWR